MATTAPTALFAAVMAPASFFLGFAVATAGFTCWNLVVPLLFDAFGFDLFDALFLSVMMDTVSSLVLVVVYAEHGKVDKPFVLYFGGVAAASAAVASRLSDSFLQAHTSVLRGSVGYVPIFFGFVFLGRAYRERRVEPEEVPFDEFVDAVAMKSPAQPDSARSARFSDAPPPGDDAADPDSFRSRIVHGNASRYNPRETRGRRITLTALLLLFLGGLCGIVGSGGGVMYVSVILLVWRVDDLPLATGTGVALMCFQCFALLADFVDKPRVLRAEMLRCLLIVLPCCVAGAVAASQALLCMSRMSVNLMVALVSFSLGAVITLTSMA
mmetsp:Transcript_19799/g.66578  ORF Transcript_19799/g.66578 Transcript_19799/m.66578 type:complete len:326 (-) Transcript_19799:290-1267(-)